MDQQHKPRFNRSALRTVKAEEVCSGPAARGIKLAPEQGSQWRRISMRTLGELAARSKVSVAQVHQLIGEGTNRAFTAAFLDSIDLYNPTPQDMEQIKLYSHLFGW